MRGIGAGFRWLAGRFRKGMRRTGRTGGGMPAENSSLAGRLPPCVLSIQDQRFMVEAGHRSFLTRHSGEGRLRIVQQPLASGLGPMLSMVIRPRWLGHLIPPSKTFPSPLRGIPLAQTTLRVRSLRKPEYGTSLRRRGQEVARSVHIRRSRQPLYKIVPCRRNFYRSCRWVS